MVVERTTQFILDNLASVTARQEEAAVRAAATERRLDRRMDSILTLIKGGMKMIVKLQESHRELVGDMKELAGEMKELSADVKELSAGMKELAAVQKRTEQRFDRWLESMNKGANGHKKRSGTP
jgi:protein-tyrosine-phosphatase